MKKLDKLLKDVELFEKLAVYGDRSSFLEALANNNLNTDNTATSNTEVPKLNIKKS